MAQRIFNFQIENEDLKVRFSCTMANYRRRIGETMRNLEITKANGRRELLTCPFVAEQKGVKFRFDDDEPIEGNATHAAVFFENTDYPMAVEMKNRDVEDLVLYIADHKCESILFMDKLAYGTINFKNQVGKTDFNFKYSVEGKEKSLQFGTEVLSYKMDYRTDMKSIIRDIEREYSMLSYSFLKQTYLTFETKSGKSTELIWWQIFQTCYEEIVKATKTIINSPKRRLKSAVKYERAERLPFISPENENEYCEFENDPKHLYRVEEMFLSKDTIENRFLKYAIKEIHRRFNVVREHIKTSLKVDDSKISANLDEMQDTLMRLEMHPFFKTIGQFKGFSQDSLVMKRAHGYSQIYQSWIILQCGYELEEGVRKLEVKDISELYEIWCFIKVKNIVSEILDGKALEKTTGRELTTGFIRQLVYGTQSEVKFCKDNVELASVMYNAQAEQDETNVTSAIAGTTTYTTIQRPDIVLRLTKENDDIQYTYLFDAKYRINDTQLNGYDVPPVDAINQMHRYRDAIYLADAKGNVKNREIIGGYVLFPGNINKEEYADSYYARSADEIGIGAFPLKPGQYIQDEDGNLILDPMSSESVLKEQIKAWIEDKQSRITLLNRSVPQHGLHYADTEIEESYYFLSRVDADVNEDKTALEEGRAKVFYSGWAGPVQSLDLLRVRFFIPIIGHTFKGIYKVDSISIEELGNKEKPMRMKFKLSQYQELPYVVNYGVDPAASKGIAMKRYKFYEHCEKHKVVDKI